MSNLGRAPDPIGQPRLDAPAPRRTRGARNRLFSAAALSIASHLLILLAVLSVRTSPPQLVDPRPITVQLIQERALAPPAPTPAPSPSPAAAPRAPTPPKPARPHVVVRRRPTPPDVNPLPADEAETADSGPELSDAQLAGAATAGSGSGSSGGACDMARLLQGALRKDPLVQAAVAGSAGKAIMVWNGDWVRRNGEDGKGLAAVREAIMWEVAFAPKACRSQPVHGLVLLSLNGAQGPVRLAVGVGEWRWSDLLTPRAMLSGATSEGR